MQYCFEQMMRWFGPDDPVDLWHIRQAGCTGVVTALHQIPVGEIWTRDEIEKRKAAINAVGLSWTVVESLPVSEDIKRQTGDYLLHIDNYKKSLRNLASAGLSVVTYNFMPIFDWMRTDIAYTLPDRSKSLYFEKKAFIAFDLFLLQRAEAVDEYSKLQQESAKEYFKILTTDQKEKLFRNCLLGLPGSKDAFTPENIKETLKNYHHINPEKLKHNLFFFLKNVIPVTEECGLKMAIHPDDPPFPLLGLPRIVSTENDLAEIFAAVPSPSNGLCYCTGSLGVRPDNDLEKIAQRFSDLIHFIHLRSTTRDKEGNFYEADHLTGDVDMYSVIRTLVKGMHKRRVSIPMRPDHGHQMLDDLSKITYPGYSAIGRLKGLAEIRGLEYGIQNMFLNL